MAKAKPKTGTTKKPRPKKPAVVGAIDKADQTGQAWQRGVSIPCEKNQ